MKLVFYDDFKLGAMKGDTVVDLTDAVSGITHTSPQDLLNQLIENFSQHRSRLQQAIDQGSGVPVSQVRLRSPLPKPNIICMAVNYMEDGTRAEPAPINAFIKLPNTVIGPGDTMVLPDVPAAIFEGEAEMALVISKRLPELHRRLRPRLAPCRKHLLSNEIQGHLCAHGPVPGNRRRNRRPAEPPD